MKLILCALLNATKKHHTKTQPQEPISIYSLIDAVAHKPHFPPEAYLKCIISNTTRKRTT
jgi:hypothetical protein